MTKRRRSRPKRFVKAEIAPFDAAAWVSDTRPHCNHCLVKPSSFYAPDPLYRELYGDSTVKPWCRDCYNDRSMEI